MILLALYGKQTTNAWIQIIQYTLSYLYCEYLVNFLRRKNLLANKLENHEVTPLTKLPQLTLLHGWLAGLAMLIFNDRNDYLAARIAQQ